MKEPSKHLLTDSETLVRMDLFHCLQSDRLQAQIMLIKPAGAILVNYLQLTGHQEDRNVKNVWNHFDLLMTLYETFSSKMIPKVSGNTKVRRVCVCVCVMVQR